MINPAISDAFRITPENRKRSGWSHKTTERARAVRLWRQGKSISEIGQEMGVHHFRAFRLTRLGLGLPIETTLLELEEYR